MVLAQLVDTVAPGAGTKDIGWRESFRTPWWWPDRDGTCSVTFGCSCPDA